MGLCLSCRKSNGRFKGKNCSSINSEKKFVGFLPAKTTKICNQIQSTVSNHESNCSNCLNRQSTRTSQGEEVMATSFSNMNLTNPIKGLVSKKRNRYKQDGFNLDLTYITQNIIAMGYPASNIESVYRNHIDDVVKFLDQKHPGHYYIYNLCSERSYDKTKFHNKVKDFPFDDHNPPRIDSIEPFCQDVKEWLERDPDNVAVVHCKAGKGRTGTMICCYLLHSRICATADQALNFYGEKRTQDTKGVTIPSQVRYVRYYEQLVYRHLRYRPLTVYIKEFIFDPAPTFAGGPGNLSFSISHKTFVNEGDKIMQRCKNLKKSEPYKVPVDSASYSIKLDYCLPLTGDIKIEFYNKIMMRKDKLFHFWFNTFFVGYFSGVNVNGYGGNMAECCALGDESCYELIFYKNELDKLIKKDKQHKVFHEKFKLTVVVQKIPREEHHPPPYVTRDMHHMPDTTPSDSSAESTDESEEDDWDSGESTYL